jgi:methyl-accepting chemotaxis protein
MMQRMTIRARLLWGFTLVGALALLAAGVGAVALRQAQTTLDEMDRVFVHKKTLAASLVRAVDARLISIRTLGLLEEPAQINQEVERIKEADARFHTVLEEFRALSPSEEQTLRIGALEAANTALGRVAREAEGLMGLFDTAAAVKLLRTELPKAENEVRAVLEQLAALAAREARDSRERASRRLTMSVGFMTAVSVAALGLGTAIALWVSRAIQRGLETAVSVTDAVAAGDLACRIDTEGPQEIAMLMGGLRRMQAALRALVADVKSSVDNIHLSSSEIARGNMDLSARNEQQTSSLQQTAASMEQLTGAVRSSAAGAVQARGLAQSASQAASQGGQVVGRVVDTMREIRASSQRISEIIAVIDSIAFQTNILALNAAVESARAGEQGRGFAVVAAEVRSLAQRSAQAAREIKQLIVDSVEKVEAGSRLVGGAGTTMQDLVVRVEQVADLVDEIAGTAEEQSGGLAQVNGMVSHLDGMTQQNAALVEQAAAASASLAEQANRLAGAVAMFRLQPERA